MSPFFIQIDSLIRTIPDESLQRINSICRTHECELVDYAIRGSEHRMILDLFVDNRRGITLTECTQINRALLDESANDKFLSDVYTLEVSSPGVDRPLTHNWQYEKHIGRLLQVQYRDGTNLVARLVSVSPDAVRLEQKDKRRRSVEPIVHDVPFDLISTSRVEIEFK